MAYFAKLDDNNVVLEVHAVDNNELLDSNGLEREEKGIAFLVAWSSGYPYWKQTSYNGSIRKNFAGIGFKYDSQRNAFIAPKPFSSWILDEDTCTWNSPTPMPDDGKRYQWNEQTTSWVEITES